MATVSGVKSYGKDACLSEQLVRPEFVCNLFAGEAEAPLLSNDGRLSKKADQAQHLWHSAGTFRSPEADPPER